MLEKLFTLILIFAVSMFAQAAKKKAVRPVKYPITAYLDAEENVRVQVFNYPDHVIKNKKFEVENWKSCETKIENGQKICVNANGWLPRDANIEILGPSIIRPTRDWRSDDEIINEEYVKIRFSYPGMEGEPRVGYIEKSKLTNSPNEAFFATVGKDQGPSKPASPCGRQFCPNPKLKEAIKDPAQLAETIKKSEGILVNRSVVSTAEQISGLIGKCYKKTPSEISQWPANSNVFQNVIASDLRKLNVPRVEIEGHTSDSPKLLDVQKLEAIDALARTIYAEMGQCFSKGLQYPMAVGRIIHNRAEATCSLKGKIFIQGDHPKTAAEETKVATTPQQFSLWKRSEGTRKNGPLLQALCPPIKAGGEYYAATRAPQMEYEIWKNAVYIATQTMLFPESFKKRTSEMEGRYYYTSGLGWFHGLEKVQPSIEGRPLDNPKCMEVWRDMAQDAHCNGGKTPSFDKKNPVDPAYAEKRRLAEDKKKSDAKTKAPAKKTTPTKARKK